MIDYLNKIIFINIRHPNEIKEQTKDNLYQHVDI